MPQMPCRERPALSFEGLLAGHRQTNAEALRAGALEEGPALLLPLVLSLARLAARCDVQTAGEGAL